MKMNWLSLPQRKPVNILSLSLLLITFMTYGQTPECALFPVMENGKLGCIDAKGNKIIEPRFIALQDFSENLAAARISGTYGYINSNGAFVIAPQFDYATPFAEGLALVYLQGKPAFINTKGEKPFRLPFPYAEAFNHGLAQVKSASGKVGFINTRGKLVIDTIFRRANSFINGTCVVEGLHHKAYPDEGVAKKLEIGVIDSIGRFIIPFGKFEEIDNLKNGYFMVEASPEPWDTLEGFTRKTGFVDRKGKIILLRDHKNNSWVNGPLCDGMAKISLYKNWKEADNIFSTENSYEGFINLKGEIVVNDTAYKYVSNFAEERAFVRLADDGYLLIDTKGKVITSEPFTDVVGEGFQNGLAIVQKDGKYGVIDCHGQFIVPPTFTGLERPGIGSNHFFFYNDSNEDLARRVYGVARTDGTILFDAIMDMYDPSGFHNGLLKCMVKDKFTYLDEQGETVWQETENNTISNLNIDYINRGYFYAYSKPSEKDLGGFGRSDNYPEKISGKDQFPVKSLSVVVHPDKSDTVGGGYKGIPVFVSNTLRKKIEFNAQDSRLNMIVEAKNTLGQWQDIEYLPSSWCGNSYHTLTLDARTFMEIYYSCLRGRLSHSSAYQNELY